MKRYIIKTQSGKTEYIDILKEMDDSYIVRFTRNNDGNVRITEEIITKHLFNICIQTGYLSQIKETMAAA